MPSLSPGQRILLFLYSDRNLVGSALALAGLGAWFAGLFDDWWCPIVAGLYLLGYLAVPATRERALRAQQEATHAGLSASVAGLLDAGAKLPREAIGLLQNIQLTVDALVPRLADGGMAMDTAAVLINAVTRDLPETVNNYARLPTAFANLHPVDSGKTCKQLLLEQLALLDGQLRKIAESVYREDAEAVVVNGKFLQEKFHSMTFLRQ
jgi:hypothetical protein